LGLGIGSLYPNCLKSQSGAFALTVPFVKINGETHYLWRAVDHEGEILESYVTRKRNKSAALRFFRKTLKRHGQAESIVTDGLKSYPAAMRELGNLER
jgi:putative transposase